MSRVKFARRGDYLIGSILGPDGEPLTSSVNLRGITHVVLSQIRKSPTYRDLVKVGKTIRALERRINPPLSISGVSDFFGSVWDGFYGAVSKVWKGIKKVVGWIATSKIIKGIWTVAKTVVGKIYPAAEGVLTGVDVAWNAVSSAFGWAPGVPKRAVKALGARYGLDPMDAASHALLALEAL